jgi:hypothetical protein
VVDLSNESPETLALYGVGEKHTDNYGRQCLMARRLAEAGVRYIQVNYGDNSNNPAWDQHSNLPKHGEHARAVDDRSARGKIRLTGCDRREQRASEQVLTLHHSNLPPSTGNVGRPVM